MHRAPYDGQSVSSPKTADRCMHFVVGNDKRTYLLFLLLIAFYIALFSALEKTHCVLVECVSEHVLCTPYDQAPAYSVTSFQATYVGCMCV